MGRPRTNKEILDLIETHGHMSWPLFKEMLAEKGLKTSEGVYYAERRAQGITTSVRVDRCGDKANFWKGGEFIHRDGYWRVLSDEWKGGRRKYALKHVVEWERQNGKIPAGHRLLCLGDRSDWRPDNWRLMSHGAITEAATRSPIKLREAPNELKPALATLAQLKVKIRESGR